MAPSLNLEESFLLKKKFSYSFQYLHSDVDVLSHSFDSFYFNLKLLMMITYLGTIEYDIFECIASLLNTIDDYYHSMYMLHNQMCVCDQTLWLVRNDEIRLVSNGLR
jgi:hypothetical protein